MAFYAGQKVVCVDDSPSAEGDDSGLIKGKIYTVNKVISVGPFVGLGIVEIPYDWDNSPYFAFKCERFRPAVDKKTDISVFTKMLNTTKVTEDA